MDGGARGEVESESFSADAMTVTFIGFNTHPGYAKGRMVNAIKVAADFINRLPADRLSPETTDGHDGFVHPYVVQAGVERTSVKLLIRDFETAGAGREGSAASRRSRARRSSRFPGARVELSVEESYRNMREILALHPDVVEYALRRGARGRPRGQVARRFAEGPTARGSRSWVCRHRTSSPASTTSTPVSSGCRSQDMEKAVEVIVNLARIWATKRAERHRRLRLEPPRPAVHYLEPPQRNAAGSAAATSLRA